MRYEMKQEILRDAKNIILQRKLNAEFEYEEKIKPLTQNAEYSKLQKELATLIIEEAKSLAYGMTEESKKLSKKIEEDKKRMEQIAKKNGLSGVCVNYSCKTCKDEGYVEGKMCECLKKEISGLLLKGSGFGKLENFADAKKTCGELLPIYNLMQKWCNSDFKKNLIFIAGPTGVGKTYLMRAMANELISRGKIVKLTTAFNMNLDFRDFTKYHNEECMKKYLNCEVLFIDDLGTEPIFKNVTLESLYLIINERKMRKIPTVITSNLDMNDIKERYDERVFSRIADRETSITIYLDGDDKRLKNNNKN